MQGMKRKHVANRSNERILHPKRLGWQGQNCPPTFAKCWSVEELCHQWIHIQSSSKYLWWMVRPFPDTSSNLWNLSRLHLPWQWVNFRTSPQLLRCMSPMRYNLCWPLHCISRGGLFSGDFPPIIPSTASKNRGRMAEFCGFSAWRSGWQAEEGADDKSFPTHNPFEFCNT